jgi:hypothetical protein
MKPYYTREELEGQPEMTALPTNTDIDKILPMFRGNYYLLAGGSGIGKSTLVYWLASQMAKSSSTYLLSTEIVGSSAYTVARKQFKGVTKVRFLRPEYTDLDKLETVLEEHEVDFLIVDVIDDLPGYQNIAETDKVVIRVAKLAHTYNCVVLGIHHLKKGLGNRPTMQSLKGPSVVYQKPSGIMGLTKSSDGERTLSILKPSRIPVDTSGDELSLEYVDGTFITEILE